MKPNDKIVPANRVSAVEEYYFSRKLKEVAQMRAQGADVINLGIGSPDEKPSEKVIEALSEHAFRSDVHGYQSYIGIPALREAFASWYDQYYGVGLDPDGEILPLIGSKEGILHISMAFLNPSDQVLIPNPGYPTYTSVTKLVGATPLFYDLTQENGWEPDWEELEKTDLSKVKLMWVNYPHMPTGKRASVGLFEKLVAFGQKHAIVICNDNPYSFILNDQPLSILQVQGAKECCIELNSLSKSHNMAGWRMGMLTTNKTFAQWILRFKSNIDSGMFLPLQQAAVEALQLDRNWYKANNELYRERRRWAEEIFNILGCRFDAQQQGLFLWGEVPPSLQEAEELSDRLLYQYHLFLTPGSVFGSNGKRYIRISLCAPKERLQEAILRLKK